MNNVIDRETALGRQTGSLPLSGIIISGVAYTDMKYDLCSNSNFYCECGFKLH